MWRTQHDVTACSLSSLQGVHQAATEFPGWITGVECHLHGQQNAFSNQEVPGDGTVLTVAMACPILTVRPRPAGCSPLMVDQMKLATVTMLVVGTRFPAHGEHQHIAQPFQTADSQIWIGVGLCRHSPHPGADVGHGGTNRQMACGDGNSKATVVAITGND